MPQFKRVPLTGSDELFRPTVPGQPAGETGGTEPVQEPIAAEREPEIGIDLSAGELRMVIDALQGARFPDQRRPRLTITDFEVLGALQERLRSKLPD